MTSVGTVLKTERKWQKNSKLSIFSAIESQNDCLCGQFN